MAPAAHFLRGLGWFRAAGLTSPVARTFVADDHAPLSDEQRSQESRLVVVQRGADVANNRESGLHHHYRRAA